jgi:hypothetical protein
VGWNLPSRVTVLSVSATDCSRICVVWTRVREGTASRLKTCAELDGKGPGRSGLDPDPRPESSRRGRILKMRLGVNPNSSGHGVLFGSMFFIPYSVLSSLVAGAVLSGLDDALVSYRDARSKPSRADRALSVGVWTLAWGGFAAVWAAVLSSMILIGTPIMNWVLLGAVATLPIAFFAYRAAVNPAVVLLAKRCPKPCLWGFVLGLFTVVAFGGLSSLTGAMWGVVLLYAYATPLALVLAAGAARAAGLIRKAKSLTTIGIAYVVVGLILVIPVPPISVTSYNPVGLFFPFWGFGVPWVATIWSLLRLTRAVQPGVSKIESDSSQDRSDEPESSLDASKGDRDEPQGADFLP